LIIKKRMNASHVLIIVIIFIVLFYYLIGYKSIENKIQDDVEIRHL